MNMRPGVQTEGLGFGEVLQNAVVMDRSESALGSWISWDCAVCLSTEALFYAVWSEMSARCHTVWWITIVVTRQNDAAVAPSVYRDVGRPGELLGITPGENIPSLKPESLHIGNVQYTSWS